MGNDVSRLDRHALAEKIAEDLSKRLESGDEPSAVAARDDKIAANTTGLDRLFGDGQEETYRATYSFRIDR